MSWNKITLFKFQQADRINSSDKSEVDKLLFTTCIVFDKTEYQLDNMPVKKVNKLVTKVSEIFQSEFNPQPCKRIGKFKMNYHPSTLTFGQYIEISFFIEGRIGTAHYAIASIVSKDAETHRQRADYFLHQPVTKIVGSLNLFTEKFQSFNNEYNSLFGLSDVKVQEDKFNKRYGWIYSASRVAEYERITLEQAFALPIRNALNDLVYLKAKDKYEQEQLNKK